MTAGRFGMAVGKVGVKGAKKVASGAKKVATKVDDVAQNKKVQRVAAAKQQVDQQRQQAQQQKQQQQQRASEMARAKASTGDGAFGKAWMTIKGQTFHPSIEGYLEDRTPKKGQAQIAPRPSAFPNEPDEPVNIETQRGELDVEGLSNPVIFQSVV